MSLACGPQRVDPVGSVTPDEMLVLPGTTESVVAAGLEVLAIQDGVQLIDPSGRRTELAPDTPRLREAVEHDGLLVAATSRGVWAGTDFLIPSDIDVPASYVASDGETLYVGGAEGVFAWTDGDLAELSRLDAPVEVFEGQVWAGSGRTLVRDGEVVRRGRVTALSSNELGLWSAQGREVVLGEGGGWRFDEDIVDLEAGAKVAWVVGESGAVWLIDGDEVFTVDAEVEDADADRLGRLLVPGFNLVRLSVGRPIAIAGLEDLPSGSALLEILPEVPEQVTEVRADLDGEALELDAWEVVVTLDPGPHTLEVEVDYADAETSTRSTEFEVTGVGEATWAEHIEPLYDENCAVCHAGDTETALDTAELWEQNIELILDNLRSGAMPLGRDPLSATDVARVQAWADGGFE